MSEKPNSILTLERPDLWVRALKLATDLTGYVYLPKVALPDGRLFACGGGYTPPQRPRDPVNDRRYQNFLREIQQITNKLFPYPKPQPLPEENDRLLDELAKKRKELDDFVDGLNKKDGDGNSKVTVQVPEGSAEWLLHEVGHWVAATPEERALPNYGLSPSETGADGDREWQAWAFQEIVLAPLGPARDFTAPTVRDGAGFSKVGPIAETHTHTTRKSRSTCSGSTSSSGAASTASG